MKFSKGSVFGVENFGSIVIAVLAIIVLGFLAVNLYGLFADKDMKNASAFVDSLVSKIDALDEGQENTFFLQAVKGWILVSWDKDTPVATDGEVISIDKKPQRCFNENCLCFCSESINNCQEKGYCRVIDRKIEVSSYGSASSTKTYSAGFQGSVPTYTHIDFSSKCLYFRDNLLEPITVSKDKSNIKIKYSYGSLNYDSDYPTLKDSLIFCDFVE
jgi:hypothetical protein